MMRMKQGKKNDRSSEKVPFYTYPVDTVRRSIQLVTGALTSLRGAAKCLDIFSDVFTAAIPSHTAIQNWILQYGLSELMRPVPKRDDWILVLDHTIEFGHQKCLVILGITQKELLRTNGPVTHQQMKTLVIDISHKSNSDLVGKTLDRLIGKIGIPVQIVSDHGSELKKAIKGICSKYPSIKFTYDITHKCGLLFKHALGHDILWRRFQVHYSYTKRKCVHSRFAFLAPAKLQDKSRWMNLDTCVGWANKIITFKENMDQKVKLLHIEKKEFRKSFWELFGWLDDFSESICRWNSILTVASIARDEVKSIGLRADTVVRFNQRINAMQHNMSTPPVQIFLSQLKTYLQQETQTIAVDQKFLGTSDIIESVFAKYKGLSARTPMKGVGKTVLTIPVLLGQVTCEKVRRALKSCPNKKVARWLDRNIGQSVFAQRINAFAK